LTPLKTIRLWAQDLGAGSAKDYRGTKSYVLVGELSFDNTQVNRVLAGAARSWEAGDGIAVLVLVHRHSLNKEVMTMGPAPASGTSAGKDFKKVLDSRR